MDNMMTKFRLGGGGGSKRATMETEPSQRDAQDPPRKAQRRRDVISCIECHRRKQKCDRKQPCNTCIARNTQAACHYHAPSSVPRRRDKRRPNTLLDSDQDADADHSPVPDKVVNFGYTDPTTAGGGPSTLGLLRRIDRATAGDHDDLARIRPDLDPPSDHTRSRYRHLIRRLPDPKYVARLTEIFLENFNHFYFILEPAVFHAQLADWNENYVPALLSSDADAGPRHVPPEMRAFPAVLFQAMATSLLTLSSHGPDAAFFAPLKGKDNLSFEDLAGSYNEAGISILALLGKRQMGLATVQAGFLRATFLKYTALVTESWHAIGVAIRDAQEIGLHRQAMDPVVKPAPGQGDEVAYAEAVLQNQWDIEHRRLIWHNLCVWDLHTALVLGRPVLIDGDQQPPLPVDAPIPTDRSRTVVLPRRPDDPPTPITRNLWVFRTFVHLREVAKMESEGPFPRDNFERVDRVHAELKRMEGEIPACFRLDNPDTRFDDHPDCHWLVMQRAVLPQLAAFCFVMLHRPYVFTRPKSRVEALKACLQMMRGQKVQFSALKPEHYRTFSIFYGTFDAIVLLATIFIVFPKENQDLLPSAVQDFKFAVERFEALSVSNDLAKAGVGVLRAIWARLKKSLVSSGVGVPDFENPRTVTSAGTPASRTPASVPTVSSATSATMSIPFMVDTIPATASPADSLVGGDVLGLSAAVPAQGLDWSLPPDFDWSSIQPIYATNDLIYNDLMTGSDAYIRGSSGFGTGVSDPGADFMAQTWQTNTAATGTSATTLASDSNNMNHNTDSNNELRPGNVPAETADPQAHLPWQFEGDFGDDTVWSVLNSYNPF